MNDTTSRNSDSLGDTSLPVLDGQRAYLQSILETRPLYIGIETTNICNAQCVFCAYPKMSRAKSVMDMDLFHKIIRDYSDMGGGAVSLTPIVGDALIDPHILDRIRALHDHPDITHIALTTNAIAWSRFSKDEQKFIVTSLDSLSISMGGPDKKSYALMYGVERFDRVVAAIDSICDIKAKYGLSTNFNLAFRVDRPLDELFSDPRMSIFQRPEINQIDSMNRFSNWGGMIEPGDLPKGAHLIPSETDSQLNLQRKTNPCFVFSFAPEITVSGIVSACGCMNAEVEDLVIGDVRKDHLRDIWNGPAFRRLKSNFGTDRLCDTCVKCTYYQDSEDFLANPALGNFRVGDNPWLVIQRDAPEPAHILLARTLDSIAGMGSQRVALYGAGAFTRKALSARLPSSALDRIVAIVDDNPEMLGDLIQGIPIVSQDQAVALGIDIVVLSTDQYVDKLIRTSQPLRVRGITIVVAGELVAQSDPSDAPDLAASAV